MTHRLINPASVCVLQLTYTEAFSRYEDQLAAMMRMYGDRWGESLAVSLENLRASLPHVWLGLEGDRLVAAASLTDEVPGRHAYLHGVHHPLAETGAVEATLRAVLRYAFEALDVLKIKAECLPAHWGARGFCRRFGFSREVVDEGGKENLGGVLLYALSREVYEKRFRED